LDDADLVRFQPIDQRFEHGREIGGGGNPRVLVQYAVSRKDDLPASNLIELAPNPVLFR